MGREALVGGPLRLVNQRKMWADSEAYFKRLGLLISPKKLVERTLDRSAANGRDRQGSLAERAGDHYGRADQLADFGGNRWLLATIRELRASGVSVIYISHRLGEVEQIADRAVVLRDGRNAGELAHGEIRHENMVALMVGRKLEDHFVKGRGIREGFFQVEGLRTSYRPHHRVSFEVAKGEILGFAGLVGAGRSEMAQAIFGVEPPLEGTVRLGRREVKIRNAREAINAGIYLVPEDRRHTGLITGMTVRENITLPGLKRYSRGMLDQLRTGGRGLQTGSRGLARQNAVNRDPGDEPKRRQSTKGRFGQMALPGAEGDHF